MRYTRTPSQKLQRPSVGGGYVFGSHDKSRASVLAVWKQCWKSEKKRRQKHKKHAHTWPEWLYVHWPSPTRTSILSDLLLCRAVNQPYYTIFYINGIKIKTACTHVFNTLPVYRFRRPINYPVILWTDRDSTVTPYTRAFRYSKTRTDSSTTVRTDRFLNRFDFFKYYLNRHTRIPQNVQSTTFASYFRDVFRIEFSGYVYDHNVVLNDIDRQIFGFTPRGKVRCPTKHEKSAHVTEGVATKNQN